MTKGLVALDATIVGRVQTVPTDSVGAFGEADFAYQWPGTYFIAAFRGRQLFLKTGEGRQGLHLVVDGQPAGAIVSLHPSVYRVTGLARGSHTVQLKVITESQAGPAHFEGFAVRAEDRLPPVQRRMRQIEFIGDSYTVGYGNTSASSACSRDEVWATTDNSLAFGPLTAEHFGADYQVNAISGRGVVRNYNGASSDTLPKVYPFVLFDKQQAYRDATWQPQIIVVGLGTNDFSTPLHSGEPWKTREELHAAYQATLVGFLKRLREDHPAAILILWATDGEHGETQSEVGKVVERLKEDGDSKVEFVSVRGLGMSGCDGHPSAADDRTIAARLGEVIEAHPGIW